MHEFLLDFKAWQTNSLKEPMLKLKAWEEKCLKTCTESDAKCSQ